jgi:hypothetical protein
MVLKPADPTDNGSTLPEDKQNAHSPSGHRRPGPPPLHDIAADDLPDLPSSGRERPFLPGGSLFCAFFGIKLLLVVAMGVIAFAVGFWWFGLIAWGFAALVGLWMRWRLRRAGRTLFWWWVHGEPRG